MFVMGSTEVDWIGNPSLQLSGLRKDDRRGYSIFTYSQLMSTAAKNKQGEMQPVEYEQPLFLLDPITREEIFQACSPVFGVVTSRMNRISGMSFEITTDRKEEDRLAEYLKTLKQIRDEYPLDSFYAIGIRIGCFKRIKEHLWDVLPDLSNFNSAMLRWKRRITSEKLDNSEMAFDWLNQPNKDEDWAEFSKKLVSDMHVHGSASIYKESVDGILENLYVMPGGSIIPAKSAKLGGYKAYIQAVPGYTPQLFYGDEVIHMQYVPSSSKAYGNIPLDSLVNKVAESLFFERFMAEQADGTRPPEKILILGEQLPVGDLSIDLGDAPVSHAESKRLEHVVNEARRGAIRVLSGYGQPFVLDLTRENIIGDMAARYEVIKQDIAIVFNMSNMEINASGGDGTSGRNTADAQERIENAKGTLPITQAIENKINYQVLPFKFGHGYKMKYRTERTDVERYNILKTKMDTGIFSTNEIRVADEGLDPFNDPQYDIPPNTQPLFPDIIKNVKDRYSNPI